MTTNNTTFAAITSGTRDSRLDRGAVYFLNGNSTNGRLNLSMGATWLAGDKTYVVVAGDSGNTYMRGVIRGGSLTYAANPGVGQRVDFSSTDGSIQVEDMEFLYFGSGSVFTHLENSNNSFAKSLGFFFDMDGGAAYVQLANREYANLSVDVSSRNQSDITVYVSRSHAGQSSLPFFGTSGITELTIRAGSLSTSHGRIYDPTYQGAANNLISLKTDRDSSLTVNESNNTLEYFTLDVTDVRSDNLKIRVVNQTGDVLFDSYATNSNTTLRNFDNSVMAAYIDRSVVPILVRTVGATLSTERDQISYTVRRAGFREIAVNNEQINAPIVISEMLVDSGFSGNPSTLVTIGNAEELFDSFQHSAVADASIDYDILTAIGDTIVVKTGWTLEQSTTQAPLIAIDNANKVITFKMHTSGFFSTDKFTRFRGTVGTSLNDNTDMLYLFSNGTVRIAVSNLNPELFNTTSVYILYRTIGATAWQVSSGGGSSNADLNFVVQPNTDYEVSFRVPGYEWRTFEYNSGEFGGRIDAELQPHRDLAGATLFDRDVDPDLINSFSFDLNTRSILQTNSTGGLLTIPFLEAYVGTQIALHNPINVMEINDPMVPNATRDGFIIPLSSGIRFLLSNNSTGNVFADFTIKFEDLTDAIDRVNPGTSGNYLMFATQSYNLAVPYPTAEDNASAVKASLTDDFSSVKSDTESIKLRVDNLPQA
ncbi:hypothetical protein NVP1232O_31 [Vibrio phage 1.232.O._10N.261.51.E11]|nr:hypothetical protein NVP1232O_31 [Vibrio phage 1.232.O._10N.261.51.E11]